MDLIVPKTISTSSLSRASTASYYNTSGVLKYSPINTLRIGYNPSSLSDPPFPVLEATAQSNVAPSEDIQSAMNVNALNVGYHAAKSPDGTFSANRYVENTANAEHSLTQNFNTAGRFGILSIYAKAKERSQVYLRVGQTTAIYSVIFDLTAGTASVETNTFPFPATFGIQSVGNGWYRCYVSGFFGLRVNTIGIYNGSSVYTGDGISGVYLWGVQQENTAIVYDPLKGLPADVGPTSYMPSVQTFSSGGDTRYHTNSTGLQAVSSNVGRLEYTPEDLTLAPKLLLEPTVQNMLLQASFFNAASWVKTSVNVTTAQIDPATTNNAGMLLADSSSSVIGSCAQTVTVANDSSMRVFSVFLNKTTSATTFPGVSLTYSGGSSISSGYTVNTNTGVVTQNSAMSASPYINVRSFPAFWRVSIGFPNNSSGNTSAIASILPSVETSTVTGVWSVTPTGSIIVWGAQLEQGFSETSHIPTVASVGNASADVFTTVSTTRQPDLPSFGLIYTNIPENELPLWSSATTYGIASGTTNTVIYNHVRYASLQASNIGHQPDISPTFWSVIGATNAYSMFDTQVGTQTVGTVGGSVKVWVEYDSLSSLNLINVNADSVAISIYSSNLLVYSTVIDFTGGSSGIPITDYSLTGLPVAANTYAIITASSATTAPAIGNLVVGNKYYIGSTETSPTIGIVDYSIKTVDAFGNPTLTKRGYAKRMNTKQLLDDNSVDITARLMAQVRATPCVWNANTTIPNPNSNNKTSLIVYGYYKDWEIECAYTTKSYLTVTIEGLI